MYNMFVTDIHGRFLLYKRSHNAICHEPASSDAIIPYISRRLPEHEYVCVNASERHREWSIVWNILQNNSFPFITVNIVYNIVIIMYTENMTATHDKSVVFAHTWAKG
jgi:hypothetical protein